MGFVVFPVFGEGVCHLCVALRVYLLFAEPQLRAAGRGFPESVYVAAPALAGFRFRECVVLPGRDIGFVCLVGIRAGSCAPLVESGSGLDCAYLDVAAVGMGEGDLCLYVSGGESAADDLLVGGCLSAVGRGFVVGDD